MVAYPLVAIYALLEAFLDARKRKRGGTINHLSSWLVRIVIVSVLVFVTNDLAIYEVLRWALLAFTQGVWFWILFDPAWNYFMGNKQSYIGNTDWLDKWARKIFGAKGGIFYTVCKIILLSLLVWLV